MVFLAQIFILYQVMWRFATTAAGAPTRKPFLHLWRQNGARSFCLSALFVLKVGAEDNVGLIEFTFKPAR
jgi:hypothetical protein